MALNNLGLGFVFTAQNLASGTITRLKGQLNGLGTSSRLAGQTMRAGFTVAAGGVANLLVGVGTLAASFAAARAAGEFQQGLAGVGAVTRATAEEMQLLRRAAIDAGIATQFSPTEAVEGLTSLATAGQTATQATQTLIPVLDLAAGSLGQLGVSGAAEAVVGTLNSYGLAADEAGNVTDRLLRITQLTNFQTRDFESGLAKAAASGAVFGQGLNDVLITMGLLRNRNIDASSSATAFREATRRLASDQHAQAAVAQAGVEIFDEATGRMRSVVDITTDLVGATREMTDEQRNSTIAQAFGARGLLAFNAIQNASFTTMRDGRQVTLEGAEAIEALRHEMERAEGTAAGFRDTLLDTFTGQMTLLRGTIETFAVSIGEPFARVFKPIVRIVVETLNAILVAFDSLPDGMKDAIAGAIVFVGALLTVSGIVGILTGLFIVLLPFIKAIALAFVVGLAVTLPFIAAVGAAIAIVLAFRTLLERNVGGIGEFFANAYNRAKLAIQGIIQLFTQGGFSGAVREELNRADNAGIRQFAIRIFQIGFRVQKFFEGLSRGIDTGLREIGPSVTGLVTAFERLGQALGIVGEEGIDAVRGLPSTDFAAAGARVANVLVDIVETVVGVVTFAVDTVRGFVDGLLGAFDTFSPVFDAFGAIVTDLGRRLTELFREFGVMTAEGEGDSVTFGQVLGGVFGTILSVATFVFTGIIGFIDLLVASIQGLIIAWRAVSDFFEVSTIRIGQFFGNMGDTIRNTINRLIIMMVELLQALPEALRPEGLEGIVEGMQTAIGNNQRRMFQRNEAADTAVAQVRANREIQEGTVEQRRAQEASRETGVVDAIERLRIEQRNARMNVSLNVDGEQLSSVMSNNDRRTAARAFTPAPADSG